MQSLKKHSEGGTPAHSTAYEETLSCNANQTALHTTRCAPIGVISLDRKPDFPQGNAEDRALGEATVTAFNARLRRERILQHEDRLE